MTITDAIARANAYFLTNGGECPEPSLAHLVKKPGKIRYWIVLYPAHAVRPRLFGPDDIVDGGEYILQIDDHSGEVSVMG